MLLQYHTHSETLYDLNKNQHLVKLRELPMNYVTIYSVNNHRQCNSTILISITHRDRVALLAGERRRGLTTQARLSGPPSGSVFDFAMTQLPATAGHSNSALPRERRIT